MDTQAHGCFGCSVYTIIKFPWNVSLVDANLGGVTLDNANLQEANLSSADPACV
ncbi:pentapeptide repeat-containing protein [Adonisia turfae]